MAQSSPTEDVSLRDILSALSSMNSNFVTLSTRLSNLENANLPPSTEIVANTQPVSPFVHTESIMEAQHGIRAQWLWTDKTFNLSREPARYAFKLENPEEYLTWQYAMLANLDRDGLALFVETNVPRPSETTDDSAWLQKRWDEFQSAARTSLINSLDK